MLGSVNIWTTSEWLRLFENVSHTLEWTETNNHSTNCVHFFSFAIYYEIWPLPVYFCVMWCACVFVEWVWLGRTQSFDITASHILLSIPSIIIILFAMQICKKIEWAMSESFTDTKRCFIRYKYSYASMRVHMRRTHWRQGGNETWSRKWNHQRNIIGILLLLLVCSCFVGKYPVVAHIHII